MSNFCEINITENSIEKDKEILLNEIIVEAKKVIEKCQNKVEECSEIKSGDPNESLIFEGVELGLYEVDPKKSIVVSVSRFFKFICRTLVKLEVQEIN